MNNCLFVFYSEDSLFLAGNNLGIMLKFIHRIPLLYHPEYKGIRPDVYAKDENNTRYNVEMQVAKKKALEKRTRYYHGQIDMEMLVSGSGYDELPDAYVIFICDFDPFEKGKYRYTFLRQCEENSGLSLEDGCKTIFLSTKGTNPEEVPEELPLDLKRKISEEKSLETLKKWHKLAAKADSLQEFMKQM